MVALNRSPLNRQIEIARLAFTQIHEIRHGDIHTVGSLFVGHCSGDRHIVLRNGDGTGIEDVNLAKIGKLNGDIADLVVGHLRVFLRCNLVGKALNHIMVVVQGFDASGVCEVGLVLEDIGKTAISIHVIHTLQTEFVGHLRIQTNQPTAILDGIVGKRAAISGSRCRVGHFV